MSRDPLMMNKAESIESGVIRIPSLLKYDMVDYDFYDDKDIIKYLNDVEKVCRNSFEYHHMVKFLRENIGMNRCSFYENVNNVDTFKIKIHIHHEPLTLFDIAKIVFTKRQYNHENLDEEMTSKEVMLLHFNLLVGLIPLAETVHELVHNQYLFVPTDKVFGYYQDFMNMYDQYIDQDLKDKVNRIEKASESYTGDDQFVLEKHFLYTDVTGSYNLPKYDDVKKFLNQRIQDINTGAPIPHEKLETQYPVPIPFDIVMDD